jgi:hypothetical protein
VLFKDKDTFPCLKKLIFYRDPEVICGDRKSSFTLGAFGNGTELNGRE